MKTKRRDEHLAGGSGTQGAEHYPASRLSDLELTRLCAEAMGLDVRFPSFAGELVYTVCDRRVRHCWSEDDGAPLRIYDPLNDDTEAMALVKKCGLSILRHGLNEAEYRWVVECYPTSAAHDPTLNRAIVECVAKMRRDASKGSV